MVNPLNLLTVRIDVTDLHEVQASCKKHGLQLAVLELQGPGGGNPHVQLTGPAGKVASWLRRSGYGKEEIYFKVVPTREGQFVQCMCDLELIAQTLDELGFDVSYLRGAIVALEGQA